MLTPAVSGVFNRLRIVFIIDHTATAVECHYACPANAMRAQFLSLNRHYHPSVWQHYVQSGRQSSITSTAELRLPVWPVLPVLVPGPSLGVSFPVTVNARLSASCMCNNCIVLLKHCVCCTRKRTVWMTERQDCV